MRNPAIATIAEALVDLATELQEPPTRTITFAVTVDAAALEAALASTRPDPEPTSRPEREADPRPLERRLAANWGDIERGEGRRATIEMERRVARALQRGGAFRLTPAEAWRRLQVWSAARTANGRRPSADVLRQIVASEAVAARWERA